MPDALKRRNGNDTDPALFLYTYVACGGSAATHFSIITMNCPKALAMRKLLLIVFLFLASLNVLSQENGRQCNIICILDCTRSMIGYNNAPNVWSTTKDFIKNTIESECKKHPSSKIVLLPFQGKPLDPFCAEAKDFNWVTCEKTLDEYVNNITATNICDAWSTAIKYIDKRYDNSIILLTDGKDNIGGVSKLAKLIKGFCGKYNNTHGFYVELTNAAVLPTELRDIIEQCESLHIINASDGIPQFGAFQGNLFTVNTRDLPVKQQVEFTNADYFRAQLGNVNNDFIKIELEGNKIENGKAVFVISRNDKYKNVEALNHAINGSDNSSVSFSIKSSEVEVLNPEMTMRLCTAPVRALNIKAISKDRCMSTELERTRPFLWVKQDPVDTLRWILNPEFNAQAVNDNASVEFGISANVDLADCALLFDGKEIAADSIIQITPNSNGLIELVVPSDKADGNVMLRFDQVSKAINLDKINDVRQGNFSFSLNGEYKTSMPLLEWIFWILVALIVLFIIIWFAFVRNRIYPKFRQGVISVQTPYFANIRVRGSRMVVLTPMPRKQGWIDKLVKGRVIYHVNAAWPCECQVTPSGKNLRFNCPSSRIVSDPAPVWHRGESYKLRDMANDDKTTIDINAI